MNTYKVFVNDPQGEQVAIDVSPYQNINHVKASVSNLGFNFSDLSLSMGGKKLKGKTLVKNAGIKENSTINAMIEVKGKNSSHL